jgi:RNA polymerase sigma-70 factor, ECF subfamily
MLSLHESLAPFSLAWRVGVRAVWGDGERASRMNPLAPDAEAGFAASALGRESTELMRKIAGGDRDALAKFYDLYSRPLFGTAFRILNDAAEAEDVVQDVFLTVWSKAAEFDTTRGSAFGWTVALTRNRAIDRLRMRRRRKDILDAAPPADLGYAPSSAPDSAVNAVEKEQATAVRRAVEELTTDQRNALELAFFSGLTQQEIAAKLNEPLGTVKARIRRGMLKLREHLGKRL